MNYFVFFSVGSFIPFLNTKRKRRCKRDAMMSKITRHYNYYSLALHSFNPSVTLVQASNLSSFISSLFLAYKIST
jgi:hypothetical protein